MANEATSSYARCSICNKEKVAYLCDGCSQKFCFPDLTKHQQDHEKQLDCIITDCDAFRQYLLEIKKDMHQSALIQQVNEWENNSIRKIKETAEQCRQELLDKLEKNTAVTEKKLNKFVVHLKNIHQENDFNETDISELIASLKKLEEEFRKPSNISLLESGASFVNKISVKGK